MLYEHLKANSNSKTKLGGGVGVGCVDKKVVIGIPIEDYYFALSLQCASTKKGRARPRRQITQL